jgi:hypothetical protein
MVLSPIGSPADAASFDLPDIILEDQLIRERDVSPVYEIV